MFEAAFGGVDVAAAAPAQLTLSRVHGAMSQSSSGRPDRRNDRFGYWGSRINIPVARFPDEERVEVTHVVAFGVRYRVPSIRHNAKTVQRWQPWLMYAARSARLSAPTY